MEFKLSEAYKKVKDTLTRLSRIYTLTTPEVVGVDMLVHI
jgi:hypothetical protein